MTKLPSWKPIAMCVVCATIVIGSPAQTLTTLADFTGTNGAQGSPGPLLQGGNGDFYGTTSAGGAHGDGTIFVITPGGTLTTLFSFDRLHGSNPGGGLALEGNDTLHAVATNGGTNSDGTVYQIRPVTSKVTVLHNFNSTDGQSPFGGLALTLSRAFDGTTSKGGAHGEGTVFQITTTNALTTLYSFCSLTNCSDGSSPLAGPVLDAVGNMYGTTSTGGANGAGTVYELTTTGKLNTLHSFCSQTNCTDGSDPVAGLVQANNGNFYGTTNQGGTNGFGTVFQITPPGTLTTLYSFSGGDGQYPSASLAQGTDGNFYGTTSAGGTNGHGTIFEISPVGALTTLHSFDGTDGEAPTAGLVQGTDGSFYGTTSAGGASGLGTVFNLNTGLGPFVVLIPNNNYVGTLITIIGTNLIGANSVTFNGIPTTFIVRSSMELKAMVPTGATTGPVQVITPTGILTSNTYFQVVPR